MLFVLIRLIGRFEVNFHSDLYIRNLKRSPFVSLGNKPECGWIGLVQVPVVGKKASIFVVKTLPYLIQFDLVPGFQLDLDGIGHDQVLHWNSVSLQVFDLTSVVYTEP